MTPPPEREPPAPVALPRWASRLGCALSALGIAFFLLQILTYGYGRDQGIYAMVGKIMLGGGMPYRDAWDFKPPGIFLVYALARALFGPTQLGVRLLEVVGLIGMAYAMVRLADRWWRAPIVGWVGAALTIMVHAQLDFWHTAQPESFGGMLTIFALLLATHERRLAWVGVGVLLGFSGLLKPPIAGGGVVIAVALAWRIDARLRAELTPSRPSLEARLRAVAAPILCVALGGVLPVIACLGWFFARGALVDLYQVLFVFTPYYTKLGWAGSSVIGMGYWGFITWLTSYGSLLTVGLLLTLVFGLRPEERWGVFTLLGVIGVHLVGIVMQGKFFPYHYGATWPLTGLLAALGMVRLYERAARRGYAGVGAYLVGVVVVALGRSATKDVADSYWDRSAKRLRILLDGARDQRAIDELASVADVNAVANREVAEAISALVPPGEPIFVYGFEPVIYDLADRPTSSRFLYNVPQRVRWAAARMQSTLIDDLSTRPPRLIVVEHRDVFPSVTGSRYDSADSLPDFPALEHRLASDYVLYRTIEDFDLYLRSSSPSDPD